MMMGEDRGAGMMVVVGLAAALSVGLPVNLVVLGGWRSAGSLVVRCRPRRDPESGRR